MPAIVARPELQTLVEQRLATNPAVALLGARQVGKSTLARRVAAERRQVIYLDLEHEADLNKLSDPGAFLGQYPAGEDGYLICIDEVQLAPALFRSLRVVIDRNNANGQFLILGSASRDLIRQSAESLAGRISYLEITPFARHEIPNWSLEQFWQRGGYPRSLLAADAAASFQWRKDYIRTFLERDIPQLGFSIPANTLGRFWRMLAHNHGELLNQSRLASAMGIRAAEVRRYLDLLEQTFVIRQLRPWSANIGKRLVKSPKIYIRDTGLLHALLDIDSHEELFGHPVRGASFEACAIENLITALPDWQPYFYRTSNGNEIDLVLERGRRRLAFEIKASTAPKVTNGFWRALDDLQAERAMIIAPVDMPYPFRGDSAWVYPLNAAITELRNA